jgi:hypothetical protein
MDALWQFFNDDVRESAALLDARMLLFFESRHASLLVEAFVLKWEPGYRYHSMRRADYPCCIYLLRSHSA